MADTGKDAMFIAWTAKTNRLLNGLHKRMVSSECNSIDFHIFLFQCKLEDEKKARAWSSCFTFHATDTDTSIALETLVISTAIRLFSTNPTISDESVPSRASGKDHVTSSRRSRVFFIQEYERQYSELVAILSKTPDATEHFEFKTLSIRWADGDGFILCCMSESKPISRSVALSSRCSSKNKSNIPIPIITKNGNAKFGRRAKKSFCPINIEQEDNVVSGYKPSFFDDAERKDRSETPLSADERKDYFSSRSCPYCLRKVGSNPYLSRKTMLGSYVSVAINLCLGCYINYQENIEGEYNFERNTANPHDNVRWYQRRIQNTSMSRCSFFDSVSQSNFSVKASTSLSLKDDSIPIIKLPNTKSWNTEASIENNANKNMVDKAVNVDDVDVSQALALGRLRTMSDVTHTAHALNKHNTWSTSKSEVGASSKKYSLSTESLDEGKAMVRNYRYRRHKKESSINNDNETENTKQVLTTKHEELRDRFYDIINSMPSVEDEVEPVDHNGAKVDDAKLTKSE